MTAPKPEAPPGTEAAPPTGENSAGGDNDTQEQPQEAKSFKCDEYVMYFSPMSKWTV